MGYELASAVSRVGSLEWQAEAGGFCCTLSIFPFLIVINLGLEELAFLTVIGSILFEDETSLAILLLSAWYFFQPDDGPLAVESCILCCVSLTLKSYGGRKCSVPADFVLVNNTWFAGQVVSVLVISSWAEATT